MATQTVHTHRHGIMAWSTRDLMVLAAISLIFGLLLIGLTYVFMMTSTFLTLMISNALFGGVWLLPAFMATYIIRRPGTALLTVLLYSLVQLPFSPYGIAAIIGGIIGGVSYELPFLLTRYRRYGLPMLIVGGALANLLTVFSHVLFGGGLNIGLGMLGAVVLIGLLSGALGGWFSKQFADRLAHSGLLSGTAVRATHTDKV